MVQQLSGSCQCGTVSFLVSGEVQGFFLCHCSRCRKDTGSAHAANMFVTEAAIEWLSGADSVRTFRIPDTRHARSFCMACGSALPRAHAGGPGVVVPAGSIDSPLGLRPTAHIFAASRADWDDHLEEVPRFDGPPEPINPADPSEQRG
jgi:hypothetical protein